MTEGILLRQVQSDSSLSDYDILVIDEVHERHLFTDYIMGIIKCLITQRKDLKVILMSATINIELFSNYFDNCPVVKVSVVTRRENRMDAILSGSGSFVQNPSELSSDQSRRISWKNIENRCKAVPANSRTDR